MIRAVVCERHWEEMASRARYNSRELAKLCRLSTRQLQRDFRRVLGCSPQRWLNQQRILAAQRSLLSGEQVKKVALELGYKHVSNFCQHFKSVNQMTASEFVLKHAEFSEYCPDTANILQLQG